MRIPRPRRRIRSPARRRRARALFWQKLLLGSAKSNFAPKLLFGISLHPRIQITPGFLAPPRHGHRFRATSVCRRNLLSSLRPRPVSVRASLPWTSTLETFCRAMWENIPVGLGERRLMRNQGNNVPFVFHDCLLVRDDCFAVANRIFTLNRPPPSTVHACDVDHAHSYPAF